VEALSLWEAAKRVARPTRFSNSTWPFVISVCAATLNDRTLAAIKPGKCPPGNTVTFINGGGRCHISTLMRAAAVRIAVGGLSRPVGFDSCRVRRNLEMMPESYALSRRKCPLLRDTLRRACKDRGRRDLAT
jgi:hypothetical protein